jgi:cell division protein FtsB
MAKRNASGEALDWSSAAKELRDENKDLRDELKNLRQEMKIVKELARRLIKNPPEKGEVIILTPIEQALLFDTGGHKAVK